MKNTVILKWNPAISSYSMGRFLNDIVSRNAESDWSIWEYEHVHKGDIFYMLKVGMGQPGIVMRGKITSDPEPGEDWSRQGRKVYYSNYTAEIMINPDTLPLLSSNTLRDSIPGFDWFAGHSGVVLDKKQSEILNNVWEEYLQKNKAEFLSRLELIECRDLLNDQLYLAPALVKVIRMDNR